MSFLITLTPYNPQWPMQFEEEAAKIRNALGENCLTIHHIGSTSVPNLSAKPILDIMPVVKNILSVDNVIPQMEELGYESKGEQGMLFRRFFKKPGCHVHVYETGSSEIDRHLKFRDYMRHHPEECQAYTQLKQKLTEKYPNDIEKYCLGKEDFILEIEKKTHYHGLRIVEAITKQEWQAIRTMRQRYFFDLVSIQDPYTWTFKDKAHRHLVLIKDSYIVGYAHIVLCKWT